MLVNGAIPKLPSGGIVPLFQNKSSCKIFHMKMSLTYMCMRKKLPKQNTFSYFMAYGTCSMKTQIETEAKGNSEMAN